MPFTSKITQKLAASAVTLSVSALSEMSADMSTAELQQEFDSAQNVFARELVRLSQKDIPHELVAAAIAAGYYAAKLEHRKRH